MDLSRPIFVVGCPRSGTTMLQLMLHAHPRIAIPPETRFVLTAYANRRAFGDLGDPSRRQALARWIVDRPETKFADLGLDPKATVGSITAAASTLGSALGTVFQAYAARFGKPRWGDKRPSYLQNLDVLLRLFPDAQIINIVRDGRDCVASLKEMSWHREGLHATVATWARAVDDARRATRALPRDQWHQLRYEDLVTDPATELTRLCAFLGEDYDPAMAFPARVAGVAVPAGKKWHHRTRGPVTTQRVKSWQTRLEPAEIALCEAALGSRLAAWGYELSGAVRPPVTELLRYSIKATPHRLAPAKRGLTRAAFQLLRERSLAHSPDPGPLTKFPGR